MEKKANLQTEQIFERSNQFLNLLRTIYGKIVVNSLVDCSDKPVLKLQDPDKINSFINRYKRQQEEGCSCCKKIYSKQSDFSERKMDFPSWLGNLDFREKNAKRIMIIGEDISPAIKKDINIAYGLARYIIDDDGKLFDESGKEVEKRNKLWFNIKKLADGQLHAILENIYITDTSKCHAFKNQNIWKSCSDTYLKKEIKLICPKVIIFQGRTSYNKARKVFERDMKEEKIPEDNFTRIGKISFANQDPIPFIKIYHTSVANRANWKAFDNNYYKRLFRNKILSEI
jgi:uracil-DNA glycosylase family 4